MCASQNMKSKTARVSKKIESAIRSAIKCYEEQHDLEWCDGCYDPDEIEEAAEMLLSAKDAEVCICIGYSLGYRNHEKVLIPQVDSLSKGKVALFEEAENGNASAMFALSRLFDQGIGEPQDPIEAYFWHTVGMEFCEYDWAGEGFVDGVADQE